MVATTVNSATFDDRAGDSGAGPDITRVEISNDTAGRVWFKVTLANRSGLGASESVQVFLDVDRELATGSGGADWALSTFAGGGPSYLFKWTGSWEHQRQLPEATFEGNVVTLLIGAGEVAIGETFAVHVGAYASSTRVDVAPDVRPLVYAMKPPAAPPVGVPAGTKTGTPVNARLTVTRFRLSPAKPRRGRTFSARVDLRRSDTGLPPSSGRVVCRATLRGRTLAVVSARFLPGVATCAWRVPRAARGTIAGVVTVRAGDLIAKRAFRAAAG